MALMPATLTRHELAGLPVRVVAAANPDAVGIAGRVRRETERTLRIADDGSVPPGESDAAVAKSDAAVAKSDAAVAKSDAAGVRTVPKRGTTFAFRLEPPRIAATDEAAGVHEGSGARLERESETAGVRPGKSGSTRSGAHAAGSGSVDGTDDASASGDREGRAVVAVDGARLLSEPATRTERAGDSTWH